MSKGETHRGGCMKFAAPRQPPAPARFLNLWEAVQELESGSYLWVSPRPWRQPASPCWRLRSPGPPVPDGAPIASLTLSLYPPSSVSLSTKPLITEFIFSWNPQPSCRNPGMPTASLGLVLFTSSWFFWQPCMNDRTTFRNTIFWWEQRWAREKWISHATIL